MAHWLLCMCHWMLICSLLASRESLCIIRTRHCAYGCIQALLTLAACYLRVGDSICSLKHDRFCCAHHSMRLGVSIHQSSNHNPPSHLIAVFIHLVKDLKETMTSRSFPTAHEAGEHKLIQSDAQLLKNQLTSFFVEPSCIMREPPVGVTEATAPCRRRSCVWPSCNCQLCRNIENVFYAAGLFKIDPQSLCKVVVVSLVVVVSHQGLGLRIISFCTTQHGATCQTTQGQEDLRDDP